MGNPLGFTWFRVFLTLRRPARSCQLRADRELWVGPLGCHWNITISSIILNLSTVWLPATARWFSMILLQHPLGDINMAVSGRPDLTSCPQGYLVLATLNHVGWVQNGAIRWEKPSGHPGSNPHLPPWKGTPIYQGEDSQLARRVWDWLPVGVAKHHPPLVFALANFSKLHKPQHS